MSLKRKSATQPLVWQRVRQFEYSVPMPLAETVRALMTEQDEAIDIWLRRLALVPEQTSPDTIRFAGSSSKHAYFAGYFKALPDNTTLVSGKISAFMTEPPPLTPEENAAFSGQIAAVGVLVVVFILCGLSQLDLAFILTSLSLRLFALVNFLIVLTILGLGHQWWLALQRRDDMLLALKNRLGIVEEITK